MIAIAIILALTIAMVAGLQLFWKNIVGWIKKAANKLREVLSRAPQGTKTFIAQTTEGLKNHSKYYYKHEVTREWEEYVYTKPVSEDEVPPEILAKVRQTAVNTEVSTTEELRAELMKLQTA